MTENGINTASLRAWESSYFAALPDRLRDRILCDACVVTVPAGRTIYEALGSPKLALIHSGQARVVLMSPEGREATLRYAGPGQVVGLPATIAQGAPVGAQAITECEVSLLNVTTVRQLAATEATVAWLFAQEACAINFEVIEFLGTNLFGSVKQRVSRHLLDLASKRHGGLFVEVDQREIADAVGSVREVVARALRGLKDDGLIDRTKDGIRLLNPAQLHEVAQGR